MGGQSTFLPKGDGILLLEGKADVPRNEPSQGALRKEKSGYTKPHRTCGAGAKKRRMRVFATSDTMIHKCKVKHGILISTIAEIKSATRFFLPAHTPAPRTQRVEGNVRLSSALTPPPLR